MTEQGNDIVTDEPTAGGEPQPGQRRREAGDSDTTAAHGPLEARRDRKRAEAAEALLGQTQRELEQARRSLAQREQVIQALERRERVDSALRDADAIDLEAARLLTEMAVSQMEQPDVEAAVEELRQRKPFLFHRRAAGSGAMSAALGDLAAGAGDIVVHAAAEAHASGHRNDLLRYLRLKRRRGA
jgi:hypothetical protein